jgi:GDP-D-mannose dehydratase
VYPSFYRPAERVPLVGSAAKAHAKLADTADVIDELVREMVNADLT